MYKSTLFFIAKILWYFTCFWTLYNDEKETGATVHYMDDEIDNGDILGQKSVKILKSI